MTGARDDNTGIFMNIMVFGRGHGKALQFSLGTGAATAVISALSLLLLAGGLGGWHLAQWIGDPAAQESEYVAEWRNEVERQQSDLANVESRVEKQIDAMTLRLGRLQAQLLRLDALGERLVVAANLGEDEFDFASVPAMGGPDEGGEGNSYAIGELDHMIEALGNQLESRAKQLDLVADLIANEALEDQRYIEGRPVDWGWVSSRYGYRTDPFHGRRTWHSGVDIASREGNDLMTVGAGVVTEAEDRGGYGYFIEVDHGDGLQTRYAHLREILVEPGQAVNKGDTIGLIGTTGRSTGPHVHFEVVKNGTRQDPEEYMQRAGR